MYQSDGTVGCGSIIAIQDDGTILDIGDGKNSLEGVTLKPLPDVNYNE